jgi:hypothetical protein
LRSETIERVFADVKEKHAMRYTYYRGLDQGTKWVKLKITVMNLKKLAMWRGFPRFYAVFAPAHDALLSSFRCLLQKTAFLI